MDRTRSFTTSRTHHQDASPETAAETSSQQSSADDEQFMRLYAQAYPRIFRFILTLIPCRNDAEEVMQETSLVLWRKFAEYENTGSFTRWACGIARFEVLRLMDRKKRFAALFDEQLLTQLAATHARCEELLEIRRDFLAQCKRQLPEKDLYLLQLIYESEHGAKTAASIMDQPLSTIYRHLDRIRTVLFHCIERKMNAEEHE
ncbi:sigma-70 family RNA polymerase sigma factor [Gimesia chilikensis]|uniref:sigma-70 family RNA polymerase sigma factor n=1 Tax=Gimesia chilikensis TaxID=2605989 RepID=UPI00118BADEE|nr:sigma-70 family RNA polymerase sigma factor [Gimesia chilikensis]MCR9231122.1 sigma-70 family RNA polymerase sigma factor [bacterium]QDT83197.1 RNA polymerase sigma factor [Gimesia chilikensis]